jgi:GPH family glycoside/pentoside/hexuronide:cation symporter
MAVTVFVSALGQHRRVAHLPATKPEPGSPKRAFAEIWESLRHPAALILLGASLIAISSTQMTFTISNFLYLYVWRFSEGAFAALPWLLMVSVVISFLTVQPLHHRFGKRKTAIGCGIVSLVFWIAPFSLFLSGHWPSVGTSFSSGLLMSFMLVANVNAVIVMISGQSMLADVVEASQIETGRRTEGIFAAGWMFVQKCATAVGIGLTGLLISLSGLPSKAVPGQVAPEVIDRLVLSYGLIVILAAIASTLTCARFPIERRDHEARVAALAAAEAEGAR